MKENTKKGERKDMGFCILQMVLNIQASSQTMKFMVMVFMNGLMGGCIRETGNKIK